MITEYDKPTTHVNFHVRNIITLSFLNSSAGFGLKKKSLSNYVFVANLPKSSPVFFSIFNS